ncbi:MAG: hypothetical protein ABSE84_09420 [Isosphaeraceae bacterium]|jgi:hypothetical protein
MSHQAGSPTWRGDVSLSNVQPNGTTIGIGAFASPYLRALLT